MASSCLKVISSATYNTWFEQHLPLLQHRSPFHHPAWLAAVERGLPFKLVFIGEYAGRDLVTVLPGFLTRRGPFRLFGSPLRGTMTSCLGPVSLAAHTSPAELRDLIDGCNRFVQKQWGVDYSEFILRGTPFTCREQSRNGWEYGRPGSYRLDLTKGEAALWAELKSRARRHIRKSQQMGIQIVPINDARMYYRMLDETFARRGTTGWHPAGFFQALIEELVPRQLLWAWGAEYEGQLIAACLFLYNDQEMYYLSGASLTQYRSLPTSYLLHWIAIVSAVRAGVRSYDLAGRGDPGIAHFKESFNPEETEDCSLYWSVPHARYAKKLFLWAQPYMRRLKRWFK